MQLLDTLLYTALPATLLDLVCFFGMLCYKHNMFPINVIVNENNREGMNIYFVFI